MNIDVRRLVSATLWACLALAHTTNQLPAQELPPVPDGADAGAEDFGEVLTRGPVHEAFAQQFNNDPTAGPIAPQAPPEPINEIPPEVKPEGDRVIWVPGYWAWDDERNDFLWVSGIWRKQPPHRRWLPGYWSDVDGGHQWTGGAWVEDDREAIDFLPAPPDSLEEGPNVEQPSEDHFWVPGGWRRQNARFVWRPGFWYRNYANWVWIPHQYRWTPGGCIYVRGYWDYALGLRGVLFAPRYFASAVYLRPGFRCWPTYAIDPWRLRYHLFIRPGFCHYYFGDYYAGRYAGLGFYPWFTFHHHRRHYDPLFTYYRWHYRHGAGVNYGNYLHRWNRYFAQHPEHRPGHTLRDQRKLDSRWARQGGNFSNVARLSKPVTDFANDRHAPVRMQRLTAAERDGFGRSAEPMRRLAQQRRSIERADAPQSTRGPTGQRPSRQTDGPRLGLPATGEPRSRNRAALGSREPGSRGTGPQTDRRVGTQEGRQQPSRAAVAGGARSRPQATRQRLTLPPVERTERSAGTRSRALSDQGRTFQSRGSTSSRSFGQTDALRGTRSLGQTRGQSGTTPRGQPLGRSGTTLRGQSPSTSGGASSRGLSSGSGRSAQSRSLGAGQPSTRSFSRGQSSTRSLGSGQSSSRSFGGSRSPSGSRSIGGSRSFGGSRSPGGGGSRSGGGRSR